MELSLRQHRGLRSRLSDKFSSFRSKSRDVAAEKPGSSTSGALEVPRTVLASTSDPGLTSHSLSTNAVDAAADTSPENHAQPATSSSDAVESQADVQLAVATGSDETAPAVERPKGLSLIPAQNERSLVHSDVWTAAYREAVKTLGKDVNEAILKGESLADVFNEVSKLDSEKSEDSALLRGVKFLESLQVPLQTFKMALDVAAPLSNLEPTASAVYGVVRSVTAVAISVSTANVEFGKQIGEMLKHLSYIDDCDTLGQKTKKLDIHKALVLVYKKLLEFLNAAFDILTRRGMKLLLKMVMENDRIPSIVKEFIECADHLHKLLDQATREIIFDVERIVQDQQIRKWLDGDSWKRQTAHHTYLKEIGAPEACQFLLKDRQFVEWYETLDSRQLVIVGDMGSGKTVTMALVICELDRRNQQQLPQPKLCYHYCQNDENSKPTHIFSSLILTLLEQFPGLKKPFVAWYQNAVAARQEPSVVFKKLKEWLQTTLEHLDRPMFLVVDGLDECEVDSRDTIMSTLSALCKTTVGLKVLLSCRPDEEILEPLQESSRIYLQADVTRDQIIAEKQVEMKLSHLKADVKALVIASLSRSAKGSLLWVAMTVDLIRVRKIKSAQPMRHFLANMSLPTQLSELYLHLFSRYTLDDPENGQLAIKALEILAVSRRYLTIPELSWAATLSVAHGLRSVEQLEMLVDPSRVLGLIQPFIAGVDFDDPHKQQVRLAHKSVRDFIIRQWAADGPIQPSLEITVLSGEDDAAVRKRVMTMESTMLKLCLRYLLLDDICQRPLFSYDDLASEALPQEVDLFSDDSASIEYDRNCTWDVWEEDMIRYDPVERGFGEFFVYASVYWVDYFGTVSAEPLLPPIEMVESLCKAGSIPLDNWITQNRRPGCTVQPRFEFDSSLYDPLSITALYGSENIFQAMLDSPQLTTNASYLAGTVMCCIDQILQWGDLSRIDTVVESRAGEQVLPGQLFRLVLGQWSKSPLDKARQGWDEVFGLLRKMAGKVDAHHLEDLLHIAHRTGCTPIVQLLEDKA